MPKNEWNRDVWHCMLCGRKLYGNRRKNGIIRVTCSCGKDMIYERKGRKLILSVFCGKEKTTE